MYRFKKFFKDTLKELSHIGHQTQKGNFNDGMVSVTAIANVSKRIVASFDNRRGGDVAFVWYLFVNIEGI